MRLRCVLFLDAKARMTKLSNDEFKTLGMNPRTARRAKKGHRHFVNRWVQENGEESFGKAKRLISCLLFGVQREQRSLPLRYEVHLEFCAPSDCSSLSDYLMLHRWICSRKFNSLASIPISTLPYLQRRRLATAELVNFECPICLRFLPSSFPIPLRYLPVFGWCATRRAYFSLFFKASRALSSGVREHVLPPEVRSDTVQAVSDTILRRVHVREPEIV